MTEMNNLTTAAMAVAVISSALLTFGGIKLMRRQTTRKRGYLMLGAAAVLIMNVMIWTV
ncbi:MAG: hypothetical protein V4444_05560 [Pseudomonadota bacterium]